MRSELAGGPMLDLGTYPVALATGVLGRPDRALSEQILGLSPAVLASAHEQSVPIF